ncbi:MAG: DUF2975 domain-containing protein [Eubacteriales bacterium]|nr:DUF2975 domain-containing protein [Eubacteriales bacterium]MDD3930951.1 DUF2975 domain-containing protein [Eubacteriales bacterium]
MTRYEPNRLTSILRWLIDGVLLINLLTLIGLPWILKLIYNHPDLFFQLELGHNLIGDGYSSAELYPSDMPLHSYTFYLVFLYLSGICTAWLLFEGHIILRRLERGWTFAPEQHRSFQRASLSLFLLCAIFVVKIFFYNTLLTMFCAALFLVLGLIAMTLADVFRQAWQVKSENDLTI